MANPSHPDELQRLRDRLDEATQREARFRLENAQDFLALQARIETQAVTIGERDGYIHQLHLERIAAHADLEAFVWMLEKEEKERSRFQALEDSWCGKFCAAFHFLGKKLRRPATGARDLPGAEFVYHLSPSPFRIYREDRFCLRGWAFPKDGRRISAIRVRVDQDAFPGRYGIENLEAAINHQVPPANPQPGFEIEFLTPPGRHRLRLEACLEERDWVSILNLPIWCRQA